MLEVFGTRDQLKGRMEEVFGTRLPEKGWEFQTQKHLAQVASEGLSRVLVVFCNCNVLGISLELWVYTKVLVY